MAERISIKDCIGKNYVFFDTRTPIEFAEDHIPGAVNLPLFSNEERAIVGTAYKQTGKEQAIEEGIKFFSKKLDKIFRTAKQFKDKQLVVYCWRGGMRSKAVANFIDSVGLKVFQLEGGHKAYRKYVRETLNEFKKKTEKNKKAIVLWGFTGAGKTEMLERLEKEGYNVIDLEGLAQHRNSMYGRVGLIPRTQKMFESLLLEKLKNLESKKYFFIEGESSKIGRIQVPDFIMKRIKEGFHVKVNT